MPTCQSASTAKLSYPPLPAALTPAHLVRPRNVGLVAAGGARRAHARERHLALLRGPGEAGWPARDGDDQRVPREHLDDRACGGRMGDLEGSQQRSRLESPPNAPVNSRSPTATAAAATWSRHRRARAVFAARSARRSAPAWPAGDVNPSEKSAMRPKPPRSSSAATSTPPPPPRRSTRPKRLPNLSTPPMSSVTERLRSSDSVSARASAATAASAGESSGRAPTAPAAAAGAAAGREPIGALDAQEPGARAGAASAAGAAAAAAGAGAGAGAAAGAGTRGHCTPAMPTLSTTKAPDASADSSGPRCPGRTRTRSREPLGTCTVG